MQAIRLEIEDSKLDAVLSVIQNMKDNLVNRYEIIQEPRQEPSSFKSRVKELFAQKDFEVFDRIDDPLVWQREQRDEW